MRDLAKARAQFAAATMVRMEDVKIFNQVLENHDRLITLNDNLVKACKALVADFRGGANSQRHVAKHVHAIKLALAALNSARAGKT